MEVPLNNYYLDPIDQLFYLNKEFYLKLNDFSAPIYVVGGQAIAYWVKYYEKDLQPTPSEWRVAHSVDIDYMSKIADISIVAGCWNVPISFATNHQPPSIALIKLETPSKEIKKTTDGLLFLDVDEFNVDGNISGNIVDFIDRPAGFDLKYFESEKISGVYSTNFSFPLDYDLAPNDNLKILTPIGCLQSRLANIFRTQKSKKIEIERIKLLRQIILYYFQDCGAELSFRKLKTHIDILFNIIISNDGIQLYIQHDVDLRPVFYNLLHLKFLPDTFISKEFIYMRNKLDDKFTRRKTAYLLYLNKDKVNKSDVK